MMEVPPAFRALVGDTAEFIGWLGTYEVFMSPYLTTGYFGDGNGHTLVTLEYAKGLENKPEWHPLKPDKEV